MGRFVVFRVHVDRDDTTHEPLRSSMANWVEATDAPHAFRLVVLDGLRAAPGEYEVYPVEGSVAFGIRAQVDVLREDGAPI